MVWADSNGDGGRLRVNFFDMPWVLVTLNTVISFYRSVFVGFRRANFRFGRCRSICGRLNEQFRMSNEIGTFIHIRLVIVFLCAAVGLPGCSCREGTSSRMQSSNTEKTTAKNALPSISDVEMDIEEGYFAGANGLNLFYRKLGRGEDTAVYLHGGPLSLSDGGYDLNPIANDRTLLSLNSEVVPVRKRCIMQVSGDISIMSKI